MSSLHVCYIFYRELDKQAFTRFKRLLDNHFSDYHIDTCDSTLGEYFSNELFEFGPIKTVLGRDFTGHTDLLIVNDTVIRSHSRVFVRYLIKKVALFSKRAADREKRAYGEFTNALGNNDILSSYFVFLPGYRTREVDVQFSISGKLGVRELIKIIPREHRQEILHWVTWRPTLRGWYGADKSALSTRRNYKRKLCTITMECELSQLLSRRRLLTNLSDRTWIKLLDRAKINALKIIKRTKSIK